MASKKYTPPPPPIPKKFSSIDQIDRAVKQIQRRIGELQKLKVDGVQTQAHQINTAEGNVKQTILDVFGPESPEYGEHQHFSLYSYSPPAFFFGDPTFLADEAAEDESNQARFLEEVDNAIGMLQGLIARINEQREDLFSHKKPPEIVQPKGETIFLVHGRNQQVKLEVQQFLSKITSTPVTILHEKPNQGRTIIEKFEYHAEEAGIAVVLLTGDDVGSLRGEESKGLRLRARQNVILELGYFMGALRRHRVIALHEEGIEKPSDYDGILYISLSGEWKMELARELRSCNLSVDINQAI